MKKNPAQLKLRTQVHRNSAVISGVKTSNLHFPFSYTNLFFSTTIRVFDLQKILFCNLLRPQYVCKITEKIKIYNPWWVALKLLAVNRLTGHTPKMGQVLLNARFRTPALLAIHINQWAAELCGAFKRFCWNMFKLIIKIS